MEETAMVSFVRHLYGAQGPWCQELLLYPQPAAMVGLQGSGEPRSCRLLWPCLSLGEDLLNWSEPNYSHADMWYSQDPPKVPSQMCLADISPPLSLFALFSVPVDFLGQLPPVAMKLGLNPCRKGQNLAFSLSLRSYSASLSSDPTGAQNIPAHWLS